MDFIAEKIAVFLVCLLSTPSDYTMISLRTVGFRNLCLHDDPAVAAAYVAIVTPGLTPSVSYEQSVCWQGRDTV